MEGFNGGADSFATRPLPPPSSYANSNGILSRPTGDLLAGSGGGAPGAAGLSGASGGSISRAQQPSHEVFMVREASRPPFLTSSSSGNRLQQAEAENSLLSSTTTGGDRGERSTNQNFATTSSSSSDSHHHRISRGGGDKEKFALPKMLKIAVVGESTAGKTAICNAFTSEGYNFSRNYHMTTGVSVYAKSIKLPTNRTGSTENIGGGGGSGGGGGPSSSGDDPLLLDPRINLVLVDSAGKPIYRELLPQYWDRLDGMALVIDLTSSSALETASDWLNLTRGSVTGLKQAAASTDGSGDQSGAGKPQSSFLGVLIGTKSDLKEQRVVSPKAAQEFAEKQGLHYFECSAKENKGIDEPFFYLAHHWTSLFPSGSSADKENLVTGPTAASRKSNAASRQSSSEAF